MAREAGFGRRASAALDRYFGLTAAGTKPLVETRAGVTTFLTMAYILFVNPAILGAAIHVDGADLRGQILTATAIAAAIGTLVMALWARYPFALAPGMGLNAYFVVVVNELGISWQTALGAVFISGVLFIVLSVTGIRELVVNAIPLSIKTATTAGIGLFLAIIGFQHAGLVAANEATLVQLGDLGNPGVWLSLGGLLTITCLLALKARGALLIGILAVTVVAAASGAPVYLGKPFAMPEGGLLQAPAWPVDLFLKADVAGAFGLGVIGVVFIFLFVDLLDTAGTLLGLSLRSGFATQDGQLPRASPAFAADAIATTVGALLGTSTTTTYIESAAGIEDGGKTGLTAVVVALLFGLSVFASPLTAVIPSVATAPVLIVIGAMMIGTVAHIQWHDYRESVPAFLTIVTMPLTYSIANGIAFGIVSYVVVNAATGAWRKVHWLMAVLGAVLVARYVYMSGG